jgi:peroxiredoxin (alkyl hydroperoxide reductase subunit C)
MLMPGENQTETSRCVFIIDPQGILRAMINYPKSIGRNMLEILRLIEALQISDKYKVATPANWKPGEKVLLPAPTTVEAAEMRANEKEECLDWYLSKKSLD